MKLHLFILKRHNTDEHNNPWFAVADVCDVLGYGNSREALSKHCRAGGVTKRDTLTAGGKQALTFIDEGNLYRLIIKSRKPEAGPTCAPVWVGHNAQVTGASPALMAKRPVD